MNRIKFSLVAALLGFANVAVATELPQQEVCSHSFCAPAQTKVGEEHLDLIGTTLVTYYGFKVYSAALYGPRSWKETKNFDPAAPAKLLLFYHRDVDAEDIVESANQTLAAQFPKLPPDVSSDVKRLHQAYKSVTKGDRYELVNNPGEGVTLLFNGKPDIEMRSQDFARHYFSIWLHPEESLNDASRSELFGGG